MCIHDNPWPEQAVRQVRPLPDQYLGHNVGVVSAIYLDLINTGDGRLLHQLEILKYAS